MKVNAFSGGCASKIRKSATCIAVKEDVEESLTIERVARFIDLLGYREHVGK